MSADGFTNVKTGADLRLGRTKQFDIDLAGFGERVANRLKSEVWRIAIAAQVSKHNPADLSRQKFFDHGCRGRVRKVTMPRHNPLLHRPRPMQIALQQFFVVIGFDDEGMHLPQPFHDHLGRVTEIGDKSERVRSGIKREANRIDRVMRHRESLHRNVANLELRASPKDSPMPVLIQRTTIADGFRGLRVCINRNVELAAKNFEPANVVPVFMSEQDAVELFRQNAALLEPEGDLARAKTAINQNFTMVGRDERAVSTATASEHRQTEHAAI